jgi:hypothetical protein
VTTVAEYHQAVKARLIADPLVLQFDIQRERRTADDGYLRARLLLDNEEELEFSEYVRRVRDQVQVVTYSFHWTDANGKLICRWDNAPHYPDLPQAPHHIHDGHQDNVLPSASMTIAEVLDKIAEFGAFRGR